VRLALGPQLEELGGTGILVGDESLGERARLDVGEHGLHVLLDVRVDDARARDVVTVLGRVGDRPALLGDAALPHESTDASRLERASWFGSKFALESSRVRRLAMEPARISVVDGRGVLRRRRGPRPISRERGARLRDAV